MVLRESTVGLISLRRHGVLQIWPILDLWGSTGGLHFAAQAWRLSDFGPLGGRLGRSGDPLGVDFGPLAVDWGALGVCWESILVLRGSTVGLISLRRHSVLQIWLILDLWGSTGALWGPARG